MTIRDRNKENAVEVKETDTEKHDNTSSISYDAQIANEANKPKEVMVSGMEEECVITEHTSGSDISNITRNLSNMSIVSPKSSVCTLKECNSDASDHMFVCSKCKKSTHYSCTGLPPYQIYLFTRKSYRLYICDDCVGIIPDDFVRNCVSYRDEELDIKHDEMKEKLDALESTISSLNIELDLKNEDIIHLNPIPYGGGSI